VPIPVFPTTKRLLAEIVEEAWIFPATCSELAIVEEAEEINPPDKVARLVADKLPEVIKFDEKVPKLADNPASVLVPVTFKFPEPNKFPENVPKPADNPARLEVPVTPKVLADTPPVKVDVEVLVTTRLFIVVVPPEIVEEALKTPLTCSWPATVEDPVEIYPPVKEAKPDTDKVDEAESGPLTFKLLEKVEEAVEINPEKVESPETFKVLVAEIDPKIAR
jgi:hypothetical protein